MIVAVIGAGVIGSAVARSLVQSGYEVLATRRHVEKIKDLEELGVIVTRDNRRAASQAGIVVLCVKPKDVGKVLDEVRNEIRGKLVISMAAATSLDFLKKTAPEAKFVRAMPNIAVLVQESFTAYSRGSDLTTEDEGEAERLLEVLGRVIEVDEKRMDAITALSGCAPAYLSVMMEAMVRGGLEAGLPRDLALMASAQSMVGTGKLVLEAQKTPSEIKEMVTTPGGVTFEGLRELGKVPVKNAIVCAIKAGKAKSEMISQRLTEKEI